MGPCNRHEDAAIAERADKAWGELEHPSTENAMHTRKNAPERPPPAVPPPAVEWGDLVTSLRTLHLGRQQVQACATAGRRPRPKPVRSRSDQSFDHNTMGKRAHNAGASSNVSRIPRHPSDDSSSGGDSDDEDSAGLGEPPLLPPTLKRAKRACSFSPTSSARWNNSTTNNAVWDFSEKKKLPNTPRQ